MRRTLTVGRSGLALAAAVVLLTACGGSDEDDSAAPTSSSTSSSAAETSAEPADSEFCTQASAALEEVTPAFGTGQEDPAALATALQAAAERVRTIEPPAAIESDWTALADGIEQFAQLFATANPADPASQAEVQQRTGEILGTLSTAATNVQTYLSTECGIVVPTDTAAPTT
jgi:hypothetical protein